MNRSYTALKIAYVISTHEDRHVTMFFALRMFSNDNTPYKLDFEGRSYIPGYLWEPRIEEPVNRTRCCSPRFPSFNKRSNVVSEVAVTFTRPLVDGVINVVS